MRKKLSTFLRLNRKWKLLVLEALLELARARVLKLLPFKVSARTLGVRREESSHMRRAEDERTLYEVSKAVGWLARHTPWESKCMEKAIAARNMLVRRGISCTLYFGMGRDPSGRLVAHAWLRSGTYVVTGRQEMQSFTPVEWFGTKLDGRLRRQE